MIVALYVAVGALVFLLIAQQALFAYTLNKMTDKLMSRDFTEYSLGQAQQNAVKQPVETGPSPDDWQAEADYLGEVNSRVVL